MRRILAASLLLSPLVFTAAAVASTPATDANAPAQARPVSTGVTPAEVIYSPNIEVSNPAIIPDDAEVVLKLNVDTDGMARDIEVVKSINPVLDAPVVTAVRKFRFAPAKLDNQAIPTDMNLTVLVQR